MSIPHYAQGASDLRIDIPVTNQGVHGTLVLDIVLVHQRRSIGFVELAGITGSFPRALSNRVSQAVANKL